VQKAFNLDGWKSVGTGLKRISPPEVIKLDLLDNAEIESVVGRVKYDARGYYP
jgi:hypothetical protein